MEPITLIVRPEYKVWYSEEDKGYIAVCTNIPLYGFLSGFETSPVKAMKELCKGIYHCQEKMEEDSTTHDDTEQE